MASTAAAPTCRLSGFAFPDMPCRFEGFCDWSVLLFNIGPYFDSWGRTLICLTSGRSRTTSSCMCVVCVVDFSVATEKAFVYICAVAHLHWKWRNVHSRNSNCRSAWEHSWLAEANQIVCLDCFAALASSLCQASLNWKDIATGLHWFILF